MAATDRSSRSRPTGDGASGPILGVLQPSSSRHPSPPRPAVCAHADARAALGSSAVGCGMRPLRRHASRRALHDQRHRPTPRLDRRQAGAPLIPRTATRATAAPRRVPEILPPGTGHRPAVRDAEPRPLPRPRAGGTSQPTSWRGITLQTARGTRAADTPEAWRDVARQAARRDPVDPAPRFADATGSDIRQARRTATACRGPGDRPGPVGPLRDARSPDPDQPPRRASQAQRWRPGACGARTPSTPCVRCGRAMADTRKRERPRRPDGGTTRPGAATREITPRAAPLPDADDAHDPLQVVDRGELDR